MTAARILIVDDEPLIRRALAQRLRAERYDVVEAGSGEEAIARLPGDDIDLVLLDDQLPDMDGMTVLERIKEIEPDMLVIVLTALARVEMAVDAMKRGAYHVASKPFDLDDVAFVVAHALEAIALRREVMRLRTNEAQPYTVDRLVGDSTAMTMLRTLLAKVARSPASTVLLTGERGTGKDLAARVLHYNSERAHRPFVNIACTTLTEALLERDLKSADGGTVLLDEIGEMTPGLQAKLLRVLEEDRRLIAATNRDLDEAVKAGTFRQDLFYRLNVLPIALPPLRQHREDVPGLLAFYIAAFNREFRKHVVGVSPAALKLLQGYTWPGNIRELRNAIERAMLLTSREWLEPQDFASAMPAVATAAFPLPPGGVDLESVEQTLVVQALERSGGNQTRAALLLGLNRDQIRYRIEKYGLVRPVMAGGL